MFSRKLPPVGVIGLGIIGTRVAANLREAGAEVAVWSRTPKPEPGFLGSAAEVAANSEVIQIFVSDDAALAEVIDNMRPQLGSGHTVCCHATVSPAAVRAAAAVVVATGAGFLEAPFTGSRDAAAAGTIAFYLAGDEPVIKRAKPVLEVNAAHLVQVGTEIGAAAVLKIATNMISATTVCILAEALAVTRACGVDDEAFASALEVNGCRSMLTGMKLPGMREGDYTPHFSLQNMLKDARFGLDLAVAGNIDATVLAAAAKRLQAGADAGDGALDYSAVMKQLARG